MSAVNHAETSLPPITQAVIVCGGAGTRMAGALGELPKALAPLAGEPLLAHTLRALACAGLQRVLLLAGVGADALTAALPQLTTAGLQVEVVVEPRPRGTAGALHEAAHRLDERFLLLFGDIYCDLDWRRLLAAADRHAERAGRRGAVTLVTHRTDHPEDSDVLTLGDDGRVIGWRRGGGPGAALGNAGVAVLSRAVLRVIPTDRPSDLFRDVVPAAVDWRAPIYGYVTSEYVRDVGTPARLAAVERAVLAGRAAPRADLVLLDRDGVLNQLEAGPPNYVTAPERLVLLPGAAEGVRLLNEAGITVAVVTNQPAVARGLLSHGELAGIHARLAELLAAEGAHLDGLHVCPHHPETFHGEGVPALRGPCRCRKPSTGLVEDALAAYGIPPWRALLVGDRTVDIQTAHNAALPGVAVSTGAGCQDGLCPAQPTWRFDDLLAAAQWIVSGEPA